MTQTSPSDARVTLLFEKFSAFVEDYASNLSMGGMFIETTDVRPVGSIVDFEVKLVDGFQLVQGLGEVSWVMPRDGGTPADATRPPAGLAVRFQSLDERGRELILKIMEEQVKSGGKPFDLEAVPAGALVTPEGDLQAAEADSGVPSTGAGSSASPPDALGGEPKILGEDGFTLLAADGPQPPPGAGQPQRVFEELEFDAPWGEHLPEIPLEVLEEGQLEPVPAPEPPAASAAGDTESASPEDLSFEDSFQFAEEAVAELDLAPSSDVGEPDFEDIDFSVPSAADGEPVPPLAAADPAPDFADAFELEEEGELPLSQAAAFEEEDATVSGQLSADADFSGDEDATFLTSLSPVAAPPELPAAEPLGTTAMTVPAADAGEDDPFELAADASAPAPSMPEPPPAPSMPEPPSPIPTPTPTAAAAPDAGGPIAAGAAAGPPTVVQDYEDDLFADEPGASAGQVLRQALAGSGRSIALAAVVLAAFGAAYVYRDAVGELLGFGAEPPAVSGAPVAPPPAPAAAPVRSPSPAAGEPQSEAAVAASPEAEVAESLLPPVIDVTAEEGVEAIPRSEPSASAAAPVPPPQLAPPACPAPSGSPATRVDRIDWRRVEGGIMVTVELNGDLAEGRYAHSVLAYAPEREMVEIAGVTEPFLSGRIEVGSSEVQQIRIGYHVQPDGNVLRIVFDFPGAGPRIAEVRDQGDRLEILVRR